MIFYFTGTGNSKYVAQNIGEKCNENVINISDELKKKSDQSQYKLEDNEIIGFVYPVYAWAPPKVVIDFIKKIKLYNYKENYVFSIATCGGSIGNTMEMLKNTLSKEKIILNSGFSLVMPNNYIIMGDVDSKKIQQEKLERADKRLEYIVKVIKERKDNIFDVKKGSMPWLVTNLGNPLFNSLGINTKKFYVNDNCTGCGICAKVCSLGNISIDKKPVWGSRCTQCLACIHRCPTKAAQYGKYTVNKGRYVNPKV